MYLPIASYSAVVEEAFVDEQDDHYLINLVMQVDTSKERLIQVLTNYAELNKLSESIVSSKIIENSPDTTNTNLITVELVNEGCVLLFCKRITQKQIVNRLNSDYIIVNVEPSVDNIKYSTQYWHFKALSDNKTRIQYSADIEPDFWIPPLLGSWLFQNRLLQEATEIINNAETIANDQDPN